LYPSAQKQTFLGALRHFSAHFKRKRWQNKCKLIHKFVRVWIRHCLMAASQRVRAGAGIHFARKSRLLFKNLCLENNTSTMREQGWARKTQHHPAIFYTHANNTHSLLSVIASAAGVAHFSPISDESVEKKLDSIQNEKDASKIAMKSFTI